MKKTTAISFALGFLCFALSLQAQYNRVNLRPDSIRVEFPEQKALVIFEVRRFQNDYHFIESFSARLKDLTTYIKRALPANINESEPRHVNIKIEPETEKLVVSSHVGNFYNAEGEKIEITIGDIVSQTHLSIRQNTIEQLLPPGWEISITSKNVNVTIYAETFEALESLGHQDFTQVVTSLQSDPKMQFSLRKRIQSRTIIRQNKVEKSTVNYISVLDMIELNANAGIGLLQDKLYPEFSLTVGILFKDHFNRRNHRLELIYNNMFFTERKVEGGYASNINSFLSLGYSKNFGNTERAHWTTVGAGLLIHKEGNYFTGKTAKFFFTTDIGSTKLNLVPELYLTNDFKRTLFGLKLNYTF